MAPLGSPDCVLICDRRLYGCANLTLTFRMSILRRSIATALGVLLLQLTLLGSGTLCAVQHVAAREGATAHEMLGMNGTPAMHATSMASATATVTDAGRGPVNSDCGGPGPHDGCGLPWAPGQCSSMTTCDVSGTPARIGIFSDAGRLVAINISASASAHAGPTFAPELPPPRA